MKTYRLAHHVFRPELRAMGLKPQGAIFFVHPDFPKPLCQHTHIRAVPTGEFRKPLKGEWYLSGAIAEAYQASEDGRYAFQIAQLIVVLPEMAAA